MFFGRCEVLDLALVSLPMCSSKKQSDNILPFAERMNFGLLSIATYVEQHGFSSNIYDPQCTTDDQALAGCMHWLESVRPKVVALSCISGFSYENLPRYSQKIREQFPDVLIVAGGQDHVGKIPETVLFECPAVDVVTGGEGEYVTLALLECVNRGNSVESLCSAFELTVRSGHELVKNTKHFSQYFDKLQPLDFRLYTDYERFPPSIEIARGCPFKCNFCSNGNRSYLKKSPLEVIDEVETVCGLYGTSDISFYFQTPLMKMTDPELRLLASEREKRALAFSWRSQTRIDTLHVEQLELLKRAGCGALDLGFESASPEMLLAMGKTKNPEQYIAKAEVLLKEAKRVGIILKLNILFYAGERTETLRETFEFLERNSNVIHSISAYPLLVFPGTYLEMKIEETLDSHGGAVCRDGQWVKRHIYPVDSSREWSYQRLSDFGVKLGKAFQTSNEYYAQRACGYYAPRSTYDDFMKYVDRAEDVFPFSMCDMEMYVHRKELGEMLAVGQSGFSRSSCMQLIVT
jgi:radical SAM superfamily enzyme YgiQ (UPF0313 family)